nr:MAG TPA: hypothetical protein [Crassvirales sp.]
MELRLRTCRLYWGCSHSTSCFPFSLCGMPFVRWW